MRYVIEKENSEITLREFLRKRLLLSSRLIKELKKYDKSILVNGEHADVTRILHENDIVELDFSEKEDSSIVQTPIDIDVIYEDENYTVINKPYGMPTHQSLNHYTDTLANALAYRYKGRNYVFRAINRLDKDTSGIVVTANNRYYADILAEKLQKNEFEKVYIAVVKGNVKEKGIVNMPIKREKDSIIKRIVSDDGEAAITEYEPVFSSDIASVLLVKPKTGRTHQIRVHLAHIGHPIIGDSLYGEKSDMISRHALHAYKLKIEGIGEFCAKIPDDIQSLIRRFFNDEISF